MRHRKKRFHLNRFTSWRKATLFSLVRNLLLHQRIKTTLTKAKAAQPIAEKLISWAKENTLSKKRQAYKILLDHRLVSLLFGEIASRFKDKNSGFTRLLRLGTRRGDSAQMVILELTEIKKETRAPKKEKEAGKEKPVEEKPRPQAEAQVLEKPPLAQKPYKKFLGGLRKIFKKERDSL